VSDKINSARWWCLYTFDVNSNSIKSASNTSSANAAAGGDSAFISSSADDARHISAGEVRIIRHILYAGVFAIITIIACVAIAISHPHLALAAVITYYTLVALALTGVLVSYHRNR
jgi:hypothetical protein